MTACARSASAGERLELAATIVVARSRGSMEALSRELARRLPADQLATDICTASAEQFRVDWRRGVRAAASDVRFVRQLRAVRGLVHFPSHHMARYGLWLRQPYVVTVHDLIRQFDRRGGEPLIHRPTPRDRLMLALDAAGIRRASALIAVSQRTKDDLIAHLALEPDRISVVYPGIDRRRFRPVSGQALPYPYLLFVGSEHPRKNFCALVEAFASLKGDPRFVRLKLIKVGEAGGDEAPFRARTWAAITRWGVEREVLLAGHVSHERLVALYSGARCLVVPSLYEGFGLPPLEAMACACPVIVSDRGALPETTGGAAMVTEPAPRALETAIRQVLEHQGLRERLIGAGLRHVARLDWQRAAGATLAVYGQAVVRPPAATPPDRVRVRSAAPRPATARLPGAAGPGAGARPR